MFDLAPNVRMKRGNGSLLLSTLAMLVMPASALAVSPGGRTAAISRAAPASQTLSPSSVPRLRNFYDLATVGHRDLRVVTASNVAVRRIGLGDTLDYVYRRLGKPREMIEEHKGTPAYTRTLLYDDFEVRVDARGRVIRIKLFASGSPTMRNGLRKLMEDFSEQRMRRLLGYNYQRKLKRVHVWPIDRNRIMQDADRERLLRRVQQYYGLSSRAEAEKKIIRAWDTVYYYPFRGIRFRVYSNVPIAGRFKADLVLVKPLPAEKRAQTG
jgi:hypothetical protein